MTGRAVKSLVILMLDTYELLVSSHVRLNDFLMLHMASRTHCVSSEKLNYKSYGSVLFTLCHCFLHPNTKWSNGKLFYETWVGLMRYIVIQMEHISMLFQHLFPVVNLTATATATHVHIYTTCACFTAFNYNLYAYLYEYWTA